MLLFSLTRKYLITRKDKLLSDANVRFRIKIVQADLQQIEIQMNFYPNPGALALLCIMKYKDLYLRNKL